MKYITRCLALLMACVMTAVLVQPTTWAKYTTSSSQTVNFTVNTNRATYTIDNILQQGNLTTVANNVVPTGIYGDIGESGGATHGSGFGGKITTINGTGIYALDKNKNDYQNWWYWSTFNVTANHQYYLRAKVKVVAATGTALTFRLRTASGTAVSTVKQVPYSDGNWEIISDVLTATASSSGKNAGLGIGGGNNATHYEYYISHLMLIDLTSTFGSGNEPPEWWCDKYIPWQDETTSGTKTVQWFPSGSKSALDTAFNTGSTGYYATSNRQNVATVNANGSVTLSGTDNDVNSTSLGNP